MIYRCLIVDDEPLARRVIEKHIAEVPSLEVAGTCANAAEAAAHLHREPVDVLFLDIRMPGLSGLEFLKTLSVRPQVILTTAFSEYALDGYEHAVVDYLLKPISFERFLRAVNKLRPPRQRADDGPESLLFKVDGGTQRVRVAGIVRVEACGNYVRIHLADRSLLVTETMKRMEAMLPDRHFVRVHRSHIVAVERIERLAGDQAEVAGREVPVGRSYRREVEARLRG